MKKILVLLLSISMLLISFSGCDKQPEPNPASDFEYEIDDSQAGIVINKYIGSSKHVIIPSHIDNLPVLFLNGAFEGSNIQSVVIPETVKSIGDGAFNNCGELVQVTFSTNSNLTYITSFAFANCVKLEKIDFSSTQLKGIDMVAFRGCKNLKEVTFSNTLEEIREHAFYECSALVEVDFPESLTDVEGGAFAYCTSLKRVVIPTKLDLISVNESIFHNVPSLEQIVFKEGRAEITGYALFLTDASVEIIVPSGVKYISPLPFLFNPPAQIIFTFEGDAPTIVEDKDVAWLNDAIIRYNPETTGWESFAWKDRCKMQPSQN